MATGEQSAADYHAAKAALRPTVLAALDDLRSRYDVVVCEGAGGAAEINLLAGDFANVPLAAAAGLPVVVVGDIERGGVFASLFGTWALLPDDLRDCVRGFVINRFRGDPTLLGDACAELERRTGVPVLGVVPAVPGTDIDAEDSLALDSWDTVGPAAGAVVDVAVVRFPRIANFGDLDPLRLEPGVGVRWVRSASALGRPDLVVLPGSKNTRGDLDWFRSSGLAAAVEACGAPSGGGVRGGADDRDDDRRPAGGRGPARVGRRAWAGCPCGPSSGRTRCSTARAGWPTASGSTGTASTTAGWRVTSSRGSSATTALSSAGRRAASGPPRSTACSSPTASGRRCCGGRRPPGSRPACPSPPRAPPASTASPTPSSPPSTSTRLFALIDHRPRSEQRVVSGGGAISRCDI